MHWNTEGHAKANKEGDNAHSFQQRAHCQQQWTEPHTIEYSTNNHKSSVMVAVRNNRNDAADDTDQSEEGEEDPAALAAAALMYNDIDGDEYSGDIKDNLGDRESLVVVHVDCCS